MEVEYPFVHQKYTYDCGPACIAMILKYYNKPSDLNRITLLAKTDNRGTNIKNMCTACFKLSLRAEAIRIRRDSFLDKFTLPCIAQISNRQNSMHFVVIFQKNHLSMIIADPGKGIKEISLCEFLEYFTGNLILIEAVSTGI